MRKATAYIFLSLGFIAMSFWSEPIYKLGDPRWGHLAVACFLLWVILMSLDWFPYLKNQWGRLAYRKQGERWIPIADAVDHIVDEYESYRIIGDKYNARLHAFKDIHALMCKGKVKVRGALHKSSEKSKQLSRKLCCKLEPIIVGTAIGPVCNLIDPEPSPPATKTTGPFGKGEVRWEGQGIYDDLRIRSRDLHKSWPDAAKQIEQGRNEDEKGPTKRHVKEWLRFVETYELEWKGNRLNILYEPTWVKMRPFLSKDTIEASNQRLSHVDLFVASLMSSKKPNPRDLISSNHLKKLLQRDVVALTLTSGKRSYY